MSRVLVTGACGNIGAATVDEVLAGGHEVRALELPGRRRRRVAARWGDRVEQVWGDVTDEATVRRAVAGVDRVLHLAAVIPPATDVDQTTAYAVNVVGTRTVVAAAAEAPARPGVTFTSTAQVYGANDDDRPPRRVEEPVRPEDTYARQKVEAEAIVSGGDVPWTICRLGMTPPVALAPADPFLFELHPETRVEFTHPREVAVALAGTVDGVADGRLLNVAGGPEARDRYLPWLNRYLGVMGVEPLPAGAFGDRRFYTDWLDTWESEALLGYQGRTFDQYLEEIEGLLGPALPTVRAVGPATRRFLLAHSRHQPRSPLAPDLSVPIRVTARARGAWRATRPWVEDYARLLRRGS